MLRTWDAEGIEARPDTPLRPGVWWWRLRARLGETLSEPTSVAWSIRVPVRDSETATSWGPVLDLDGDAIQDIAIGNPAADAGQGRVWIYRGRPPIPDAEASLALNPLGAEAQADFGVAVGSTGDLDGDGTSDLYAVGASGPERTVAIELIDLDGVLVGTGFRSTITTTSSGDVVVGIGDTDGDARGELAVGPWRQPDGGETLTIYPGALREPTRLSFPDSAGTRVLRATAAWDVDADGYADLAVLAQDGDGRHLFMFHGGPGGLERTPRMVLGGPGVDPSLDRGSLQGVGDVNGDGFGDVALRWGLADASIQVYLGSPTGLLRGPTLAGDTLARGRGDVNGDGLADVVTFEPVALGDASRAVLVHRGDRTSAVVTGWLRVETPDPDVHLEGCLSITGDVNGDGLGDVLVRSPRALSMDTSVVFLLLGAPDGVVADWTRGFIDPVGEGAESFGLSCR